MKRSLIITAIGFSLLTAALPSFAGSDYVVLQGNANINMADGATSKLVKTFAVPTNVSSSTATSRSAMLELEARHVNFTKNEIYINPPTTVCTSDGAEDANQAASIGFLEDHPTVTNDFFKDAVMFTSSRLKAGNNTLMVCIRSENGLGGASGVNLDNINLRNMAVHFQVN